MPAAGRLLSLRTDGLTDTVPRMAALARAGYDGPDHELVYDRGLWDGTGQGVGDRHLAAIFPVHGRIMNAGTSSAEDIYSAEQILRAADGLAYFGLLELADVVRRIPGTSFEDGRDSRLSRAYYALIDMDLALIERLQRKYAASPEDFDPPPTRHRRRPSRLTSCASVRQPVQFVGQGLGDGTDAAV